MQHQTYLAEPRYQQALHAGERVKTMREIDDISREVHQYLDDLDIITEEIQGKRNYHRRSRCPPQRGKGLHLFRLGKAENNQSLSSRHREYLSGAPIGHR
jgi:hypothetical protein